MKTVVMKFGGAAMASVERFALLAELVQKRKENFHSVVVVVSAMGETTDELMRLAHKVHPSPPKREQDMLISVGERVSMSLLAMALELKGIEAISFTGSQAGIITSSDHTQAKILEVRPVRIRQELSLGKVVIVAGFQGVSAQKEVTTLGRGGSDTSAVALAHALGASHVEFYKDVLGIGKKNPKIDPHTEIFTHLSYDEALEIVGKGAEVLHHQCLEWAKKEEIELQIRFFDQPETVGTTIHVARPAHV